MSRLLSAVSVLILVACSQKPPAGESRFNAAKDGKSLVAESVPLANTATGVPDWVPIYPSSRISSVESYKGGYETKTTFAMESPANCVDVAHWYDEKLKLANFDTSNTAGYTNGYCDATIAARGFGGKRTIRLLGGGRGPEDNSSRFTVTVILAEPPGERPTAAAAAQVPSWVPQYPGSTPGNVVVQDFGQEKRIEFNFTTADNNRKIVSWFEQQLKSAGYIVVSSMADDGGYGRLTANLPGIRGSLMIRVEPANGKEVVFIEAREGMR